MACLASAIFAVATPASAARFEDLQLVYHATFANGSLSSEIDPLNIGDLKFGSFGPEGINPSWTPSQGGYLVSVTRPADLLFPAFPPVIAGLQATPVNFDVGSVVGLRGTFVAPTAPRNSTDFWTIAVRVRTGGVDQLATDQGASVQMRIRTSGCLFGQGGAIIPVFKPLPQAECAAILNPEDPQPFTFEMLVDRKTGHGEGKLKVGDVVLSGEFEFAVFKADSGPAITNVGADILVINSNGQPASVRMQDFQIFTTKQSSAAAASDPLCPAEFGCRAAPLTKPH